MANVTPILLAALAGFLCALVFSSIPVGPVNLTIINEGSQRGFKWALLIGLGASVMEMIYCAVAFTGFSSIFDDPTVNATMEVFTFVFLMFLGGKFLTAKKVSVPGKFAAASEKIGARLDETLHPRSAFWIGFVRVMGNFGVLLTWIVLAAYLMSHVAYFTSRYWVADRLAAKVACVGGAWLGTNVWFCALSFSVSRAHGKICEKTLLRMQQISGFCLLLAGLYGGSHVVWQLARQLAHHRI